MKIKLYSQTDQYLKILKQRIRREYNYLSILGFDELNVLTTKKLTEEMFQRLLDFNERNYRKIITYSIREIEKSFTKAERQKLDSIDFAVLYEEILKEYNPVTGYLYKSEAERKRLRLSEEILTSKTIENRDRYNQCLNRSANLWYTQSAEYGQYMADRASIKAMKKAGIKKVVWQTEHDPKVCHDCNEKDGKVYDIRNIPPKEHYHCRCYLIPYRE